MKGFTSFAQTVFVTILAALALFSGAPVPASAAAPAFVVNTVATSCLGPGSAYTSIQSAINDAPAANVKTIRVCPGTYTGALAINAVNTLTITAAVPDSTFDWPVITPPAGSSGGSIISITNGSKGITLNRLILDGANFNSASSTMIGIYLVNASATVDNVTIRRVRTVPAGGSPTGYGVFIFDSDDNGKTSTVKLTRVNISDYQTTGVYVSGAVKLTLSESRIDGENNTGVTRNNGVILRGAQVGSPSGSIAKNVIEGNHYESVLLNDVNKISVTGNVMDHWLTIETDCPFPGATANSNKLSGNIIVGGTISVNVLVTGSTVANCNPAANSTLISNNVIMSHVAPSSYGIILHTDPSGGGHTPELKATKISGNRVYGFCCLVFVTGLAAQPSQSKNVLLP